MNQSWGGEVIYLLTQRLPEIATFSALQYVQLEGSGRWLILCSWLAVNPEYDQTVNRIRSYHDRISTTGMGQFTQFMAHLIRIIASIGFKDSYLEL